jgi:hypothetical protein
VPRVAIVQAIVRDGGSSARVRWWRDVLGMQGWDVVEVPLLAGGRRVLPRGIDQVGAVVAGSSAPEVLSWSAAAARRALDAVRPDAVVVVTLRAYSPAALRALPPRSPVILDFVDRLSGSYRQRASVDARPLHRWAWGQLGRTMARVEDRVPFRSLVTVAAGRRDAEDLGAIWLPITVPHATVGPERPMRAGSEYRWDALFVGTLDYPPNVAAVRALSGEIWPAVRRLRPGSRLCVAGRRPTAEVARLVDRMGAELVPDFDNYRTLAGQAALAITPLPLASGMQIKVLDAASAGVPQVVSPAAAAGFAPGFPARTAPTDTSFAESVVALLDDPVESTRLARTASEQMRARYTTELWSPHIAALLTAGGRAAWSDPLG